MSVIADVRKVLQDLVSPEMRALGVKIDGLDKRVGPSRGGDEPRPFLFNRCN